MAARPTSRPWRSALIGLEPGAQAGRQQGSACSGPSPVAMSPSSIPAPGSATPMPSIRPRRPCESSSRPSSAQNGPATIGDFARWFGVDPKTGATDEPGTERPGAVQVEGYQGWLTKLGARAAAKASPAHGAHLLPGFDPYTLAPISHREHIIPEGKVDEVSRPRAGSRR